MARLLLKVVFPARPAWLDMRFTDFLQIQTYPWHRVINSQGRISFPTTSRAFKEQRRLLQKEGVVFDGEAVDLHRYGWLRNLYRR